MLKTNFLKQKLASQRFVLGTWCNISSAITADIIASSGVDFLIIDREHGAVDHDTAAAMAMACESRGVSPVLRIPGIDEAEILKALDLGVHALQVPNVTGPSDVERIVAYAKYPPVGRRGFSPFTRAGDYTHANAARLVREANANVLLVVHVEGPEAVEAAARIAGMDAVDVVFVGLYDLSKAVGLAGEVGHPKVLGLLETVVKSIDRAGKAAGTIATDVEQVRRYVDMGVRYITYSVDCEVLARGYRETVGALESLRKKGIPAKTAAKEKQRA